MHATDVDEHIGTEKGLRSEQIPSLLRRFAAKFIDFVALAFTIVGFSKVTGSYVVGLLIGYAWLAFSDCGGSWGKGLLKLQVRNYATGGKCSAWGSVVRNLPIVLIGLPHRLHQGMLGLDRQQYREEQAGAFLTVAALAWVVMLATVIIVSRNAERRHIGDYLAGTVVLLWKGKAG